MILSWQGHEVRLRPRRENQVPPVKEAGKVVLRCEQEWIVNGPVEALELIRAAIPFAAEAVGDEALILTFGNCVGNLEIPVLGSVSLVSRKGGQRAFDQMLAELTETAVGLPFSSGETAALPYDRTVKAQHDILYHAFVYLHYTLSDSARPEDRLDHALRLVTQDPHRQWKTTRRSVPVEMTRRLDDRTLVDLLLERNRVRVDPRRVRSFRPIQRLGGELPERVTERHIEATVDTPENRFVKAFLAQIAGVIDGIREQAHTRKQRFAAALLADCDLMNRRLAGVRRDSMWRAVGPMVHLPAASTVLQRRRGYKELLRHFARLRLATRLPLSGEQMRDMLEAKDIALLYELWTFFAMARVVEEVVGPPTHSERTRSGAFGVYVPWDLEVYWENGIRLTYNGRFSRSRLAARRSYSVPLRPDILLEVPAGQNKGLHLFDAKFSLTSINAVADDSEDSLDQTEEGERRGTFTRGDLYKMHTYRDAIPSARSVWILYPGSEFTFFADESRRYSTPVEIPGIVKGVGGVPLQPTVGAHELRSLVSVLLA